MKHLDLNSNGVNKKITANILSDDMMRKIGFSDLSPDNWFFIKTVHEDRFSSISFSVTIPKDGSDIRIDILDDAFGQPYDYQYMINRGGAPEVAYKVATKVEYWMSYLKDAGVLEGHEEGDYI